MSLIPYLYSAFDRYQRDGTPPVRALALDYPDDPKTAGVDDQFMFGPSLLVAPLLNGQSNRNVYLPQGVWYDFYTGARMAGGRTVVVEKSLDQMPLFVKSGSILPLAEPLDHIDKSTVFNVRLRIYGDHPADTVLIEDDGESLDYLKGAQTAVRLSWKGGVGAVERTGKFRRKRFEIAGWDVVK
jgi:alpha-D-xyloside xylohydrolase